MAAVEILETFESDEAVTAPHLQLVPDYKVTNPLRFGPSLAQRRASRARMLARRRRTMVAVVLAAALTVLMIPGHVFGATTGTGLPSDLSTSSVLASGMDYVVQPGDTVSSIARDINPVNPASARLMLVRELGSSVVVPGEHVLIP
jgi:hypothetical protein